MLGYLRVVGEEVSEVADAPPPPAVGDRPQQVVATLGDHLGTCYMSKSTGFKAFFECFKIGALEVIWKLSHYD